MKKKERVPMKRLLEFTIPLIIVGTLSLSSCSHKHLPPPDMSSSDSSHVEYRDSLIYSDSLISVPIPLESDQAIVTINDTSHRETSLAESDAWVGADGFLHHVIRNKRGNIDLHVPIPEHWIVDKAHVEKSTVVTKTIYVEKPLSWSQRTKIGTFWWLLGGLIASLLYIFRKPILALLKKFLI